MIVKWQAPDDVLAARAEGSEFADVPIIPSIIVFLSQHFQEFLK